jgi:5-methylcytosine-specific restriction protein A
VWKAIRELVLRREPCCRSCARAGYITLATIVDHIIDVAAGGAPFDEANLQPLCETCHNRKTALTTRFGRD